MATAIDSSVLLDVLLNDPQHAKSSEAALHAESPNGLVICEVVVAEIQPVLGAASIHEFLSDWQITFVSSSVESAALVVVANAAQATPMQECTAKYKAAQTAGTLNGTGALTSLPGVRVPSTITGLPFRELASARILGSPCNSSV